MPHDTKQKRKDLLRGMVFFSHVGIIIASCVLIGVLAGRFFDRRLGTSPWLLLIFSLVGTAAAFKALFDLAKKK